ncbi:MAG: hypothetical protein KTR14_07735 [Vampirovibrio sp.]|nr:hypothetical protein [Vampirovibrio sp.]
MTNQPRHYEIEIKKDGLIIELSSDDVYFISKQLDKWFKILLDDSYIPVGAAPSTEPEVPEAPPETVEEQPDPGSKEEPLPEENAPPESPVEEPDAASEPEPDDSSTSPVENETPPVENLSSDNAETPLSEAIDTDSAPVENSEITTESTPESVAEPLVEVEASSEEPVTEAPEEVTKQALDDQSSETTDSESDLSTEVKDDFEAVMDSLMEDLEGPETPPPPPVNEEEVSAVADVLSTPPQEFVAETSEPVEPEPQPEVSTPGPPPGYHPDKKSEMGLIDSLSDLCAKARPASPEDYLLLAAYYLTFFEAEEKFSLKAVNSLLVKSSYTPVNHSVIESTLSKGLVNMVPDMTGMADVSEYTLSDNGQQVAEQLL